MAPHGAESNEISPYTSSSSEAGSSCESLHPSAATTPATSGPELESSASDDELYSEPDGTAGPGKYACCIWKLRPLMAVYI